MPRSAGTLVARLENRPTRVANHLRRNKHGDQMHETASMKPHPSDPPVATVYPVARRYLWIGLGGGAFCGAMGLTSVVAALNNIEC